MKQPFVASPAVAAAVAVLTSLGCSGSSTGEFTIDHADGGPSGEASHGAGGSTGTGGGLPPTTDGGATTGSDGSVSPEVIQGCNSLCAKQATVNCPGQGTLANCSLACRLIVGNPACATSSNALFACAETSPVACDDEGEATLTLCAVEQVNVAACFVQNAADPSLAGPCMSYCANVAAAGCPNDDPADCLSSCSIAGKIVPSCSTPWKANVTCGGTATFACGADGQATAAACGLQGANYLLCLLNGVATPADGGS